MKAFVRYDPLDAATLADPYPVYARLREQAPVSWHEEMRCWVLTRYADCLTVLRDHQRFARDWRRAGEPAAAAGASVQALDPPAQTPVRSLFLRAVHAEDLDLLSGRARGMATELLDGLADRDEFDLVSEFAAPYALRVICEVLGVAPPELVSFAPLSDAIMTSMDGGLAPETVEPGLRARRRLTGLVSSWLAETNRAGLVARVQDGQHAAGVSDELVASTMRVMLQGGYSTMVAAIGNLAAVLLSHPGTLDGLAAPGALRTGVDELVRYDGPVQGTSRIAVHTTVVGGTRVEAGQVVLALLAAANHDPNRFPDPGRLVLDRAPNPHLGFGWGPHACLGTVLATAALRAFVESLLDRSDSLRSAGTPLRRRTATMRCWQALPVTFRH